MPAVTAVEQLKTFLPTAKKALILGCGLGSIIEIMKRNGCTPDFTLVEQDKVVLKWAMEFTDGMPGRKITPVCMDAKVFMQQNTAKYDFIFIDIFNDLTVPPFVYSREFLEQCRNGLSAGGHIAFNYIPANAQEKEQVQNVFTSVFPGQWVAKTDRNQVFFS